MQDALQKFVVQVRGRLIVSCQAQPHEPLYGSAIMARMAVAAAKVVQLPFVPIRHRTLLPFVVPSACRSSVCIRSICRATRSTSRRGWWMHSPWQRRGQM